jgi:pimeloyl-ACP methyl ester carboxylesterase
MIRQCHFDGMHVRFHESENPAGSIFYIHGLGESGLCFEQLISDKRLKGWTHIVPDLPGYGKSPWTNSPPGFEDQADFLGEWVNRQNLKDIIVVGHSMGSVVGMMLCEKYPEYAKTFINVEGNVSFEDCTISRTITAVSPEEFFSNEMNRLLNNIYQGGFRDKTLRSYYASLVMCDPKTLYANSVELIEISKSEKIPQRLANLKLPCIYILGDPRGTREYSRNLLCAAGIKWVAVEDSGHWPFLDRKDAFIDNLLDYLHNLP